MQIAQVIGGYTLGGADLLRRAMGKKKPEEMAQHRVDLRRRRGERTASPRAKATQLFDLMEKFAGYGFNKSHAAAYALIAYQTAYFKAHHPAAFMAANLSLVMDDTDKVRQFYDDARRATASRCCRPTSTRRRIASSRSTTTQIRYGLGGDQGHRPSGDRGDRRARAKRRAVPRPVRFLPRVDKRVVNRRAVEALVRAGAFDAHRRAPREPARVRRRRARARRARRRARPRRCRCSARRSDGGAIAPRRSSHAANGPRPSAWCTKRPASASISPAIRITRTRRSSRRCPAVARRAQADARPVRIAGVVTQLRMQTRAAARWRSSRSTTARTRRRSSSSTRRSTPHRASAARGPAAGRRSEGHAAHERRRPGAGHAHHRRGALRPRRRAPQVGARAAARVQRQRAPPSACSRCSSRIRNGRCPITIRYSQSRRGGDLELGDAWKVNARRSPDRRLREWLQPENVEIVY